MKKVFLTSILIIVPLFVFADSYDGPFCYEKHDPSSSYGNDDPSHLRGTCKPIEMVSVVSLDPSLKNDYVLAQHWPIELSCERGCTTARYSEVIEPTLIDLTFPDEDVSSQHASYDYSSNKVTPVEVNYYPDAAILLDKKYVFDYISSTYKKSGMQFDGKTFPQIVLMDRTEMKSGLEYSYNDLVALFNNSSDPVYIGAGKGPIKNNAHPSIYTFNYVDFGKHIYSPRGSLAESNYIDFDKTKLPPIEVKTENMYRGVKYVVPITSPVRSAKNYWTFTKKAGKVVLAWEKSEYILDNGTVDTVLRDGSKTNEPLLNAPTEEAQNPTNSNSEEVVSVPVIDQNQNTLSQVEQKKSFFSRILDTIRSWFR